MLQVIKSVTAIALAALCAGCGGLPIAGPLSGEVIDNDGVSEPSHVNYAVIDVTPSVCTTLAEQVSPPLLSVFGNTLPKPNQTIGIGDTLSITIWEAGNASLFTALSAAGGVPTPRGASLPPLTVVQDGKIAVPYAGRIAVAGKTTVQVERMIVAALAGKTNDPQVIVTLERSQTNVAIVGGEVAKAARIPLAADGERVLDAIADAGGVRIAVNESQVRLTRGNRTATVSYAGLLQNPADNVYLQPGDILTITRAPKTFTAFGALGRNYQIPFETDTLSVEEAVAKSGGFQDQRVDPSGVFIFRYEPAALVMSLAPGSAPKTSGDVVPVVYHLDMSQAGGYFLARQFAIRDKDIIYAANAEMNEVQKFLNLLGSVLTPAATGASVSAVVR